MQGTNTIINVVKKAGKYYIANKEVLREDARNKYINLSEKEKDKKRNTNETHIT